MDIARLYTTQVSSSSVSFLASTFIAIAILRSDGGLATPYHRIIFGLRVSDVLQSISLLTGPFAVPAGLWAEGNDLSCRTNGALFVLGSRAISLYMLMLCVYSALKTKRSWGITDAQFCQKFEKKMHLFIVLFVVGLTISGLATRSINSGVLANVCLFAALPTGCRQNPYVDCLPGSEKTTAIFIYMSSMGLEMFCLLSIVVCMAIVRANIFKQSRITRGVAKEIAYRTKRDETRITIGTSEEKYPPPPNPTILIAKKIERELMIQAILFVVAYVVTYFARWFATFTLMAGNQPTESWLLATFLLYPLGGFFNILVYTRPKVAIFRRRHPNYSWIRAFWLIIKAGNRIPNISEGIRNTDKEAKKEDSSEKQSLWDASVDPSMDNLYEEEDDIILLALEKPGWERGINDAKPLRPLRRDSQTQTGTGTPTNDIESNRIDEEHFKSKPSSFVSYSRGSRSKSKKFVSFASSLTTNSGIAEDIFDLSPTGNKVPKRSSHPSFEHLSPAETIPSLPMRSNSPSDRAQSVVGISPFLRPSPQDRGAPSLPTRKETCVEDVATNFPMLPWMSDAESDAPDLGNSRDEAGTSDTPTAVQSNRRLDSSAPPQAPIRFSTEVSESACSADDPKGSRDGAGVSDVPMTVQSDQRPVASMPPQAPIRFSTEVSESECSVVEFSAQDTKPLWGPNAHGLNTEDPKKNTTGVSDVPMAVQSDQRPVASMPPQAPIRFSTEVSEGDVSV